MAELITGAATHGWASVGFVAPILLVVVALLVLLGRGDTDLAAVTRRQVDERQAAQRLQVQALVGRVLAVAVAVAYLIATSTGATSWLYAALLAVMAAAFGTGWLIYGDHVDRPSRPGPGARRRSPIHR